MTECDTHRSIESNTNEQSNFKHLSFKPRTLPLPARHLYCSAGCPSSCPSFSVAVQTHSRSLPLLESTHPLHRSCPSSCPSRSVCDCLHTQSAAAVAAHYHCCFDCCCSELMVLHQQLPHFLLWIYGLACWSWAFSVLLWSGLQGWPVWQKRRREIMQ